MNKLCYWHVFKLFKNVIDNLFWKNNIIEFVQYLRSNALYKGNKLRVKRNE